MTGKFLAVAAAATLLSAPAFASTAYWGHPASEGMRATRALNMLEASGDAQFSHFRAAGRDFSADVTHEGQVQHVIIHPDSGQITPVAS